MDQSQQQDTEVRVMTDAHRQLLQSFMSKGILNGKETKHQFKIARKRYENDSQENPKIPELKDNSPEFMLELINYVKTINVHIKPMYMEIKKAISEVDGTPSYCLINTADTEFSRLAASDYTSSQLDIFKRLIEKIVESDSGTLSSIEALNLPDIDPVIKISKRDAEALYEKLQLQHWIGTNDDGRYYLTARAILELEHYIYEQYPGLATNCEMCRKLVLQGQACINCEVKMHIKCAAKCFQQSVGEIPNCVKCDAPWPHAVPGQGRDVAAPSQSAPSVSARDTRKRKLRHEYR